MNLSSKIQTLFIIFFFPISTILLADASPKEMNEKASALYKEGKYDASLDIWSQLVKSGDSDPNLFYNIGNAEAMLGNVAESILAYEKAKRYKPADHEIAEAIKKERSKIENAVIPVNPFFLKEWFHYGLAFLRPANWVWLGLILLLVGLRQWLVDIKAVRTSRFFNGKNSWTFSSAGISLILIGILSYHQLHRHDEAIVMTTCECHVAPADESPLSRMLHPGEKVIITDQIGEWEKVNLLNLDDGWLKKECLKQIE